MLQYKYVKAKNTDLTQIPHEFRFIFTQVDPDEPTRQFSFLLQVDKNDKYEVCDCKPSIDATIILDVTERLNKKDDYVYLAQRMRKLALDYRPWFALQMMYRFTHSSSLGQAFAEIVQDL